MARFLADENFPYPVTEELRRLGHDVATMTDLGKANQAVSDEEVLSLVVFIETQETIAPKRVLFLGTPPLRSFTYKFQHVYDFGIYPAVRNCGFICERVDETHFTGDVLGLIKSGIEAADLVIADLTEGRPNVYLEVGYAWGRGVPVIFVAKKGEKLHFDVSTHRCIFYGKSAQFAKDLEKLIRGIEATQQN